MLRAGLCFSVAMYLVACGSTHIADPSDGGSVETDAPNFDGGTPDDDASLPTSDSSIPRDDAAIATGVGDRCDDAPLLGAGTYVQSTAGYSSDYSDGEGCTSASAPERFYAIEVPAGQRLTATVRSVDDFDPSIGLLLDDDESCHGNFVRCLTSDDHGSAEDANTVSHVNTGASTVRVLVLVSSFLSDDVGSFSLTIEFSSPPANDRCDDALRITPGALAGQTLVGFTDDFHADGESCGLASSGPDRPYVINVPAGRSLEVEVMPEAGSEFDPVLNILPDLASCASGMQCLAHVDDAISGNAERARFTNNSGEDRDVIILVDAYDSEAVDEFLLTTEIREPAEGDMCTNAVEIAPGMLTGQSFAHFSNDYVSGDNCAATSGVDRAYAIDVPSTQTLTVTVTPESSLDVAVSISASLEDCDGASHQCAAGSDSGSLGGIETLTYTNVSSGTRRVFILVDNYDGEGEFMVSTSVM